MQKVHDPPFVYIAALMRTGSTLLSEALTRLPYSYIFREPHIGKNDFQVRAGDRALLNEYGVKIEQILTLRRYYAFLQRRFRWLGYRQDYMVRVLKYVVRPKLASGLFQLGVKEVRNRAWHRYSRHFPDMVVVITARDPRDIYLSTMYRWKRGEVPRRRIIAPEQIADEINTEFRHQMAIRESHESLLLRYEDFCRNPDMLSRVKAFVRSPMPELGEIGAFLRRHPRRAREATLHGAAVTDKQVSRWRREKDLELRRQAERVLALTPEYTRFWGYGA